MTLEHLYSYTQEYPMKRLAMIALLLLAVLLISPHSVHAQDEEPTPDRS